MEPKGLSERGRESDNERERETERKSESVNRKGVFGLFFLLRERCCCRGALVFLEKTSLTPWVGKRWSSTSLGGNIAHEEYFYTRYVCVCVCVCMCVCVCVRTLLTAARLVVEARGHEEALLGRRRRRQSPLVWREDGNHQRRELALDLLMEEEEGARATHERKGMWKRVEGGGKVEKKHEQLLHLFQCPRYK